MPGCASALRGFGHFDRIAINNCDLYLTNILPIALDERNQVCSGPNALRTILIQRRVFITTSHTTAC